MRASARGSNSVRQSDHDSWSASHPIGLLKSVYVAQLAPALVS